MLHTPEGRTVAQSANHSPSTWRTVSRCLGEAAECEERLECAVERRPPLLPPHEGGRTRVDMAWAGSPSTSPRPTSSPPPNSIGGTGTGISRARDGRAFPNTAANTPTLTPPGHEASAPGKGSSQLPPTFQTGSRKQSSTSPPGGRSASQGDAP